jgi:hypothetical protein
VVVWTRFAKIGAGQVQLTGPGGFVPGLIKAALERGLQAELSEAFRRCALRVVCRNRDSGIVTFQGRSGRSGSRRRRGFDRA